jgi:hypothetical protein
MNEFGEPNMGNPSVRFDEGRERVGHWPRAFHPNRSCLLYRTKGTLRFCFVAFWVACPIPSESKAPSPLRFAGAVQRRGACRIPSATTPLFGVRGQAKRDPALDGCADARKMGR